MGGGGRLREGPGRTRKRDEPGSNPLGRKATVEPTVVGAMVEPEDQLTEVDKWERPRWSPGD